MKNTTTNISECNSEDVSTVREVSTDGEENVNNTIREFLNLIYLVWYLPIFHLLHRLPSFGLK